MYTSTYKYVYRNVSKCLCNYLSLSKLMFWFLTVQTLVSLNTIFINDGFCPGHCFDLYTRFMDRYIEIFQVC